MKITVYNNEYEFSHIFDSDYINEYGLDVVEPFDCLINEIKTNHPFAYGWLESISQSKISNLFYWTDFTHIRFSK
jgi:hypothetical protein